jgi:protein-S-isoprenylcysteine O-methyltransferase Ste14
MPNTKSSKTKTIIKVIAAFIIFIALLFGPAGTLNWPEAWIFLILYSLSITLLVIWLKKHDPELLKERVSVQNKEDVKKWDRIIISIFSILFLVLLAVTGLDAARFHWSQVPLWIKIFGFLCFVPASILIFLVMKENTYLSEMVRIQEDRGQQVCTTGPYKHIRHPMYIGIITFLLCLPLALGSFYALIPASLAVILFILRTSLEDKTLQKELPGYDEYAEKVRYRLIPGVW